MRLLLSKGTLSPRTFGSKSDVIVAGSIGSWKVKKSAIVGSETSEVVKISTRVERTTSFFILFPSAAFALSPKSSCKTFLFTENWFIERWSKRFGWPLNHGFLRSFDAGVLSWFWHILDYNQILNFWLGTKFLGIPWLIGFFGGLIWGCFCCDWAIDSLFYYFICVNSRLRPRPTPEQGGRREQLLMKSVEIGWTGKWLVARNCCSFENADFIDSESLFSSQPLAISIPLI